MSKKSAFKISSPGVKTEEVSPELIRLFQARNEWDRLHQLSNLLKDAHIDLPDFFDSPVVWSTICREPDPERLAWRLAQEILRHTGGRIPDCLTPYADRADFKEEERARDQAQLQKELAEWLKEEPEAAQQTPKRDLSLVWKITRGIDPLENTVRIDLRANSPKVRESSRNFFQVRSLCHELGHRPEIFSLEDTVLLRWLSDYLPLLLNDKQKHGSPFLTDNRSLLVWLQQWGQTGRCRYEDGSAVEFSPLPARIIPRLDPDSSVEGSQRLAATVRMEFEVANAAGLREPLSEAYLLLAPKADTSRLELELICVKGCFYRLVERPPRALLALAMKSGTTRFEAGQTRHFLPQLLRRFPNLQAQVRIHLKEIPSKPKFYFFLDEEDALQIRLLAQAKEGNACWEWSHRGWVKSPRKLNTPHEGVEALPAPEAPAESHHLDFGDLNGIDGAESMAEIWDEVPAESDCAASQEWLLAWNGETGELCGRPEDPGWWQILGGKRLPALIKLWKDRSPHWEYFGNRRFQGMISGQRHAFPKLKIQSSGMDWFTVKTEWEEEGLRLTLADWQKLRQTDDPYVKLGNGAWVSREGVTELSEVMTALGELGLSFDDKDKTQTISTLQLAGTHAGVWNRLQRLTNREFQTELKKLQEAVSNFTGIPEIPIPAGVKASLRPYQKEGLSFLVYAGRLKLGAILADDMGLGKTIQTLAWLQYMRDTEGPMPSLVVCPASVAYNWKREVEQFTPGLTILPLAAGDERHELRGEIPKHDVIITNYALLRRDLAALKKFSFRAIILDEAQNIKNPDSMVAKAAKVLEAQHRIALTGTPLENRLLDLWSIVEFVHPGYLPARGQFNEQYDRNAPPQSRALLSSRLRPLILRRLKRQVAKDLPERIEERIDCELTDGQRKLYLAELQRSRQALRELDPVMGPGRIHALAALTRLRQICCHPSLAGGKGNLGSGKTTTFLEMIEPLYAGGHKVLVFSQFVEMLKILQGELVERGRPHYMLTGQTTNRAEVVESFQTDPRPAVFLLSLKAAGTGLNLTSASYVVLYDPWWNPAVEAQAIDRTHRIGQDRTVIAYRLVTRDTVEEKIWQLQQKKAQMVADVLGEEGFNGSLTKDDL
jgi:superfamily II DNA or RNA helicase